MAQNLIFIFLSLLLPKSHAEMPFAAHYGNYEIHSCQTLETQSPEVDLCAFKSIQISQAPSQHGAPHTLLTFSAKGKKDHWETITPVPDNGKFREIKKESDGTDHSFIRVEADSRNWVYTDISMKQNLDGTSKFLYQRKETPINESKTLSLSHLEMLLKKKSP